MGIRRIYVGPYDADTATTTSLNMRIFDKAPTPEIVLYSRYIRGALTWGETQSFALLGNEIEFDNALMEYDGGIYTLIYDLTTAQT